MKKILGVVAIIAIAIFYTGVFYVTEIEEAIVVRMGQPVRKPIMKAGLNFKIPFIEKVDKFDKRLLEYDAEPKEIITKDKKNIVIDNYARFKISNPLLFLQTVHDEAGAQVRLDDIIYSELRQNIGRYTLTEILSSKREDIMRTVTKNSDEKAREFGIVIVDVRIKRADLPQQNELNVYKRMQTERAQQAKKYRAEGKEQALQIESKADQEKTTILAEAYRKAEEIKGEGDAKALQIYADAYNKDPDFYKFTRSLDAYKKIFSQKNKNRIIISTDSDLFNLFGGVK
ncbi:protease modulator HflC [Haliovirga abyssi]|uniref:Protein HflC n=1 Tax=Haliovirga abyssi TaxID=2996794 RepID=A0AAU9DDY4_9FUSO|nr:protease modulator HflC [Haliovirga abyssi]BDU50393.1 protein HflC [Haliovirga abyssi]